MFAFGLTLVVEEFKVKTFAWKTTLASDIVELISKMNFRLTVSG